MYLSVHFWAPTFKWGISIANIADFQKPPETLSYPQQIVITGTGLVWSRYSTVITPKNWNLFSVSLGMAVTGIYQLTRKIKHDYVYEANSIVAKEWWRWRFAVFIKNPIFLADSFKNIIMSRLGFVSIPKSFFGLLIVYVIVRKWNTGVSTIIV